MKFRTLKVDRAFGLALWVDWGDSRNHPDVGITIHITVGNRGLCIDFPKRKASR